MIKIKYSGDALWETIETAAYAKGSSAECMGTLTPNLLDDSVDILLAQRRRQ